MKILLSTMAHLDHSIRLSNDSINIYRINTDNIYDETTMVSDKYSIIMQQMHFRDGVFINTIFSFLVNLKKGAKTIYYRKLHTTYLKSFREFLKHNDYKIYVYEADSEILEYLEVECFDYEVIQTSKELISKLNIIF